MVGIMAVVYLALVIIGASVSNVYGFQGPILTLYLFQSQLTCFPEHAIYDLDKSALAAWTYTTQFENHVLPAMSILLRSRYIRGCNLRQRHRGVTVIRSLESMRAWANHSHSFTVLIGPPLGGDCLFISDWIAQGNVLNTAINRVYQVEYYCNLVSFAREFAVVNGTLDPSADISKYSVEAAVSMTVTVQNLFTAVSMFLKGQGWRRVVILHERSSMTSQLFWVADRLRVFLVRATQMGNPAVVITTEVISEGLDWSQVISQWTNLVDGMCWLS